VGGVARKTGEAAGILRASACMKGTASGVNCRFFLSKEIQPLLLG